MTGYTGTPAHPTAYGNKQVEFAEVSQCNGQTHTQGYHPKRKLQGLEAMVMQYAQNGGGMLATLSWTLCTFTVLRPPSTQRSRVFALLSLFKSTTTTKNWRQF